MRLFTFDLIFKLLNLKFWIMKWEKCEILIKIIIFISFPRILHLPELVLQPHQQPPKAPDQRTSHITSLHLSRVNRSTVYQQLTKLKNHHGEVKVSFNLILEMSVPLSISKTQEKLEKLILAQTTSKLLQVLALLASL